MVQKGSFARETATTRSQSDKAFAELGFKFERNHKYNGERNNEKLK
jgi:hypothetical protein